MLGGAVVSLVHGARESTKDIDETFQPKELMREIIADIADKYGLENDWMNKGVSERKSKVVSERFLRKRGEGK